MRYTKRNLSYLIWTSVFGACAVLVLHGCSEPKTTVSRSTDGESPIVPPTPASSASFTQLPPPPAASEPLPGGALPLSPEDAKTAWKEGVRLFDQKAYGNAALQLDLAVRNGKEKDAYAQYLLGLARFKSGELETAAQALEESGKLNSGSIKTWINLARVQIERGEATLGLQAAEAALGIDGGNADALHQQGRALAALGRRDEAIEALQLAHDTQPDNGQISNTLGFWLIQSGRTGDAVPFLESARDQLPGVAYVRNNLGVAYERSGRRDEAVTEYRAAVQDGDSGGRAASSLARLGSPMMDTTVATGTGTTDEPVTEVAANPDAN